MWWASGAVALAMCMGVGLVIPAHGRNQFLSWSSLRRDSIIVSRNSGAVALAITFALYSLVFFAVFSFLPVLLMERLKVTHQTAGLLSALAAAVNVIGNLTAGLLLSRAFSRPALLIVAFLVMGLASFGIFLPYLPDSAAFGLCLLFSTVGGVIPAILLSSASIVAPSAGLAPIVLGLIIQGNNLGQILGPTAIGGVLERFGWNSAAYIVASAALIAILVVALSLRRLGAKKVTLGMGER
jgi:predicted MFS family arabinose efflux permease